MLRLTDAERETLSDQAKAMAVSESTVIREALSAFSAAEAKPGHSESGWSVVDRWG